MKADDLECFLADCANQALGCSERARTDTERQGFLIFESAFRQALGALIKRDVKIAVLEADKEKLQADLDAHLEFIKAETPGATNAERLDELRKKHL